MFILYLLLVLFVTQDCSSQDEDDDGPYKGKFIGNLNLYHHQVSGDVYAVDEWTLLLVNFNYDGTGDDTYFWAGDSERPGPQGFIVPDQHGTTNVLERYNNEEVRLTLPEGKRISRIKWFAVYDIASQNAFGDVYVPDEFEAPAPVRAGPLAGSPAASSQPVRFLDANTVLIPELRYDGSGREVYFWTGVGPQPSQHGYKVPDEHGYVEPLRAYSGEDVRLRLAGGRSLRDVRWLALWDVRERRSLGSVLVPEALNVPPALEALLPYESSLPHCKQLHRDLQVSWEVFGNAITVEVAGKIGPDEYMSFGMSGSAERSAMLGADVAVCHYDRRLQRGFATDYNITDYAPCVQVLGRWRGVCRDERLAGVDSNQVFSASRRDGLTVVQYRRDLKPSEQLDREWVTDGPLYVVWALGLLDHAGEPGHHRASPRGDVRLNLTADPPLKDCFQFTAYEAAAPSQWEVAELFDPALRVFDFKVGPAGGRRGVAGRPWASAAPSLAWYVNGQLAPDLQLRRGLHYSFRVSGGNDPHSAQEYHPLVVTEEPRGGLERLDERAQRATRVLAGVHYTRRGRLSPTAAGGLCIGRRAPDHRPDEDFDSFRAFNRSLRWSCDGSPAELAVAPNSSWPDLVYYHSFTHAGMGGRIFVVDRHNRAAGRRANAADGVAVNARLSLPLAVALLVMRVG